MIDKEEALYIVDWDTLIFAPKERELMFIGAGIWDTVAQRLKRNHSFIRAMPNKDKSGCHLLLSF